MRAVGIDSVLHPPLVGEGVGVVGERRPFQSKMQLTGPSMMRVADNVLPFLSRSPSNKPGQGWRLRRRG